jgi:hypothetical protein
MESGDDRALEAGTPLDHALDELVTARDHLVKLLEDGHLDCLDNTQLATFMQSFERFRNGQSVVDHRLITDGAARGLPDTLAQPSMRQVLVHLLRLSPAEASRRVAAAEACGGRRSVTGECLSPLRPELAAAQRAGVVSPEQVQIIERSLAKVDRPGFDPSDIVAGERLLTDFAATYGTKDLKHLAEQVVDAIDPDGTLPDDQLQEDRRHFTLRQCRDGMYVGEFRLTGRVGAKLAALLQPLARPRVESLTDANGKSAQPVDQRTYGQRAHDALEEVCDRVLTAGDVAGVGGTPATVIVTVGLEDLKERLGFGTTSDGTMISTREVLRLANEAEIVPALMSPTGAVLELGRSRRIASQAQTHALIARDHGCSFPGCGRAPEWCERHHVVEWVDGGPTDLDNLTLLCRYHHHNFANRGWSCRINGDGLPEWRPPRWLDREQRPLVNSRIVAQLAGPRRRRRPNAGSGRARASGVETAGVCPSAGGEVRD